jgi:pterin-4a-carbinolamine dehydratase
MGTLPRIISMIALASLSLVACACSAPIDEYYKTRAKAEKAFAAGDTPTAFADTLCCADMAENVLHRPDWASWRYNNLGFYLIQKFQTVTDILERQSSLEVVRPDMRVEYKKELKDSMTKNINLLRQAQIYLAMALDIEAWHMPKHLQSKERLRMIMANLNYAKEQIEYVEDPNRL